MQGRMNVCDVTSCWFLIRKTCFSFFFPLSMINLGVREREKRKREQERMANEWDRKIRTWGI